MITRRKAVAVTVAIAMFSAGSAIAAEKWMVGDFHQHTYFTDGSYPMNDLIAPGVIAPSAVKDPSVLYRKGVMPQGYRFGVDAQANSEHGGVRARDGFGNPWTSYSPFPALGDPNPVAAPANMWRWQTLIRTSDIPGYSGPAYMGAYDWILGIRAAYPDKLALTGMEWNPPGHEHATTGIWTTDAKAIAEFEYRFDRSDTDGTLTTTTAEVMGWDGKKQNSAYTAHDYSAVLGLSPLHEKTMDAVRWMQANHPTTGYIIPAHIERAGCGVGAWSIASFRDMNDVGPNVFFGFEGIPGHEKSSNRGEFGTGSCGGGTYGGAGIGVAQVGGLWDNLLADGRRIWNFASSDFHNDDRADFWPGEYLKSYIKVKDLNDDGSYSQDELLAGLRSGNYFTVHGDLISDLDFRVFHGSAGPNKKPRGRNNATMGETIQVEPGDRITVKIRFKSPERNNCQPGVNASPGYVCTPPSVHHVQLIQGRINPTRAKKFLDDGVTPNPLYNAIDPTVASVVKTFDADSWSVDEEGYTVMTYTVPKVEQDMFFRIRGTNLGYDVKKMDSTGTKIVYGTDAAGNPLRNTPGTNSADMVWEDLWFYSNPVFVRVSQTKS